MFLFLFFILCGKGIEYLVLLFIYIWYLLYLDVLIYGIYLFWLKIFLLFIGLYYRLN